MLCCDLARSFSLGGTRPPLRTRRASSLPATGSDGGIVMTSDCTPSADLRVPMASSPVLGQRRDGACSWTLRKQYDGRLNTSNRTPYGQAYVGNTGRLSFRSMDQPVSAVGNGQLSQETLVTSTRRAIVVADGANYGSNSSKEGSGNSNVGTGTRMTRSLASESKSVGRSSVHSPAMISPAMSVPPLSAPSSNTL